MEKIDYEVPTQLRQEWEEDLKKYSPNYCEAIEGERKQRHLTLEQNILAFDSKDEALKFIKTIPFRNIPQEVILNKRDKKWVVHYLTLEED